MAGHPWSSEVDGRYFIRGSEALGMIWGVNVKGNEKKKKTLENFLNLSVAVLSPKFRGCEY